FLLARLSPDGRRLLTCRGENFATLWDADTGQRILELRDTAKSIPEDLGHRQEIRDAAFSADGRSIVTMDAYAAVIWRMTASGQTPGISPVLLNRRAADLGGVVRVAISQDGALVVTFHADGQ